VDVKGYGFYETAGKENLTTAAFTAPAPNGGTGTLRYDNLSFFKAGVAVTAMNFTLAADYIGGAVNGQLQMRPTGGVSESALLTGLTYSNGPITLGSQFGFIDSQGAAQLTNTSQRHEFIMALGGNYKLAPGLQLVAEYQYWQRHQGGWDFANNAPGTGATTTRAGLTRDAQGQSLVFATVLTW
jgi:predicted porin